MDPEQAGVRQAQGKPDTSFLLIQLVLGWTEFEIGRDRVCQGLAVPSAAWWVLALGVPQLFWKLQLQLGAQQADGFGLRLFLKRRIRTL